VVRYYILTLPRNESFVIQISGHFDFPRKNPHSLVVTFSEQLHFNIAFLILVLVCYFQNYTVN